MNPRQSKLVRTAAAFICFPGIIAAARLWYLEEQGNFHPITPDEAYRSAQLDQDELEFYIRLYAFFENWVIPTTATIDAAEMTRELYNRSEYAAD